MRSKLPDVGTTIFTLISRRAAELGAVNLGQGFPDYPVDARIGELVAAAMAAGHNQYAPMEGVARLREVIAATVGARHGRPVDADREVTVTLGATEAIFSAVLALVGAGDEAIVFDPAYDSYEPAIRLAGGRCRRIPLLPPLFRPDWDRVRAAIGDRTRLVIVNTPLNPACICFTRADLDELAAAIGERDILVLSDEVYEHVVFSPQGHVSALAHPLLAPRTLAVYSFGKALHATGLRVGYAVAPPPLTAELRKVHQFNTFTIGTPLQHAIAAYLLEKPEVFADLPAFFAAKQALLARLLEGCGLRSIAPQGTYFQLVDYSELSSATDTEFARELLESAGVATIPLAPFYGEPPRHTLLRLCFAKQNRTLESAAERLHAWARGRRSGERTTRGTQGSP